ncbi:MAG: hypothetical protein NC307_12525 [Roseburia sp.]|nr:hypothetical protein [Roseburia sp.]
MFDIEKDSEIYFYGYSQFDLVKDKYSSMLAEGYKIIGFIDKRAYDVRKIVSCWSPEEFFRIHRNNQDIVIVFLLQNGLQHEKIAENFIEEGYKKILFLPSDMETEAKRKMYGIYNAFLEGEYKNLCGIPEANEVLRESTVCRQISNVGEKWITCFVPVELLFSYGENQLYGNENIRFCIPYRELYDYLYGKSETCFRYLDYMEKNNGEEFLRDRRKLFLSFEYERNLGMDYFVETAAFVKWNDKGYFNIIDGHHRAAYLAYRGYVQIPVRMEKKDFSSWENGEQVAERNDLSDLPCPIPLPRFWNRKCNFEPRWQQVIDFFFVSLVHREKSEIQFLEVDENFGYYARFFQRTGRFKSHIWLQEKENIKVCQDLNRMFRQNIEIYEGQEMSKPEVQSAYIDMDFWREEWLEKLLRMPGFLCLVFEVAEKAEKRYLNKVQQIIGSSAEYICHYHNKEMKKIYGIARGEKSNG